MIAQHDALLQPLVGGGKYGYTNVSNGVSYVSQCTFTGSFTATGLARVLVTKENVYYAGELSRSESSKKPERIVQAFLLFPLKD